MVMKFVKKMTAPAGAASNVLDWSQFPDSLDLPPAAPVASGVGNVTAHVKFPSRVMRLTQDFSWNGNFDPDTGVLLTRRQSGVLEIGFDQSVRGVGAAVEADIDAKRIKVIITAFAGGMVVGEPRAREVDVAANARPVYVGLLEEDLNINPGIDAVEFQMMVLDPADDPDRSMAIGPVDLVLS